MAKWKGEPVRLEAILLLRLQHGRDYYVSVRGQWLPSCLGSRLTAVASTHSLCTAGTRKSATIPAAPAELTALLSILNGQLDLAADKARAALRILHGDGDIGELGEEEDEEERSPMRTSAAAAPTAAPTTAPTTGPTATPAPLASNMPSSQDVPEEATAAAASSADHTLRLEIDEGAELAIASLLSRVSMVGRRHCTAVHVTLP